MNLGGKSWNVFYKLNGWKINQVEFGKSYLYNKNWKVNTVLELDAH